jgi:glycosyltransferase involved in cell wall biosynthesis
MREIRRLLVVSHVIHYEHGGRLYAYGPYSREIDIWADLFAEIEIAAPCRREPPPGDCLPFGRSNIVVRPQRETGGDTAAAKLSQLFQLPLLTVGLTRVMRRADAIHVRCPGNLGLLGAVLAPMFSRYLVAKYAGQWNAHTGESRSTRLQRRILRSRWWQGPVTVYGEWPDQPDHVVPFFTSMMSAEQVSEAARHADCREAAAPPRLLYSGRLVKPKRVHVLLEAVALLAGQGLRPALTIVGDGPERRALEAQAESLGIASQVRFSGAVGFDEALNAYRSADVLVLPSTRSEGWPKVVAEAMAYGLICVAVAHGQVPAMLSGRGLLMREGSAAELAEVLAPVVRRPADYDHLRTAASLWARRYSLDSLRVALATLLAERWQLPIGSLRARPVD